MNQLIGKRVMQKSNKKKGLIVGLTNNTIEVRFNDMTVKFPYPAAFADALILEDEELQIMLEEDSAEAYFDQFKNMYKAAINAEIQHLKETGGKKYKAIDGERLQSKEDTYLYSFDTDSELYFPDGTAIKLWLGDKIVPAYVIVCEEFSIVFQVVEYIGDKLEYIEFTAEPWQLMETLIERVNELDPERNKIAYDVACRGKSQINHRKGIVLGQNEALKKSCNQPITFIWGPPGTGKTTTLARIAMEHILYGRRVLMLSYSNVSVDGALLKVSESSDYEPGQILRYGYPRKEELLESKTLTSYGYVLYKNPELAEEYHQLLQQKKALKRKDSRRIEINKAIKKIREKLLVQEKEAVQNAAFVATTVSKAVIDKTIYSQNFDVVIFDEASMAYIPQVVFAASLAKSYFCCLGDFRQLPAIVQNPADILLIKDIFEHTGITAAVENSYGHEWLVMLNQQYRMHPNIAKFVSESMYSDMLVSPSTIYENKQAIANCGPLEKDCMGLLDLSMTYSVCIKTNDGSRINLLSALMAVRMAEIFSKQYGVGIVTPYSAQSRLILAMIRDIRERNKSFGKVSAATVHQFQGSEKPIILYDAVDCFRMPYPGTLLTSTKNNTANRLFNVALTRAQGKFFLITNVDFMKRKKIANKLMFKKAIDHIERLSNIIDGEKIIDELGTWDDHKSEVYLGDRDEVESWDMYLRDISNAKAEIFMDLPGVIDDDQDAIDDLADELLDAEGKDVSILIRTAENITLPRVLMPYEKKHGYVTTPVTIIDKEVIWFGQPLSAADFISEGEVIPTEHFPCLRFEGKYTARMLKALLEIPTL